MSLTTSRTVSYTHLDVYKRQLTGGAIGGNGAIEISGTGSKLAWTEGTIGQNLDTGSLIVEAGAEFLIKKAGKATLNLFVENRGHMSIRCV